LRIHARAGAEEKLVQRSFIDAADVEEVCVCVCLFVCVCDVEEVLLHVPQPFAPPPAAPHTRLQFDENGVAIMGRCGLVLQQHAARLLMLSPRSYDATTDGGFRRRKL